MRRTPIVLLLFAMLTVLLLPAPQADARDGVYRGPGGQVPPGLREPSDPTPPPARSQEVFTFEDWTFWYHHNKDYREWRPGKIAADGATLATHEKILGALLDVAASPAEHDAYISGAALIALGKAASNPAHVDVILHTLADEKAHPIVAESAALALGLVGRARGREVFDTPVFDHVRSKLFGVLEDAERHGRLRQFAACAIGLLGDQPTGTLGWNAASTTTRLFAMLDSAQAFPVFEVGVLRGIALQRPDSLTAEQIQVLEGAARGSIGERRVPEIVSSHALMALGAVGDASSIGVLDETLRNRRGKSANMKRSAAAALGRLATRLEGTDRKRTVATLLRTQHEQRDASTRNFATMELFPACSVGGVHDDMLLETAVGEAFLFQAVHGHPVLRPYAALASGLLVSEIRKESGKRWPKTWADQAIKTLRERLANAESRERGGVAVALGFARATEAAADLRTIAADAAQDPLLRGQALLGLAHTGDRSPETLAVARAALAANVTDPDHRRLAACALGLLQDAASVGALQAEVIAAREKTQKGEAAAALAKIGTAEAAEALLSLALDAAQPAHVRSVAYAGLGRIVDGEPVPALARLTVCINYRSSTDLLKELFSIL